MMCFVSKFLYWADTWLADWQCDRVRETKYNYLTLSPSQCQARPPLGPGQSLQSRWGGETEIPHLLVLMVMRHRGDPGDNTDVTTSYNRTGKLHHTGGMSPVWPLYIVLPPSSWCPVVGDEEKNVSTNIITLIVAISISAPPRPSPVNYLIIVPDPISKCTFIILSAS